MSMKDGLFEFGGRILKELERRGAEEVIVLPANMDILMVRFSNNQVTVVQSWSVTDASALAKFAGRRIISSFEDLSEGSITRTADRMAKEAAFVRESEVAPPLPAVRYADRTLLEGTTDGDAAARGAEEAIDAALREGAERAAGIFTVGVRRYALLSSSGSEGYDERSSFELNVRAFRGDASGQGLSCGTRISDVRAEEAGSEAGRIVRAGAGDPIPWLEGRRDVLLGPIVCANLIERLGGSCSAFSVEAGTSCLADRLGTKVLSDLVTVYDDGSDERSLSARSFDDEGTPTRRNRLFSRGVLETYLHNSSTARRFKTETTGNAGWVAPSPWSLVVEGGSLPFDEALEELGSGVYVVSNWYTRFQNYRTGDFSTICRDGVFLVEGGEIRGPLRGVRISDNLLRMFQSVKAVCRERGWVKWWEVRTPVFLPAMIIGGVTLTKAQQ